MRHICPYCNTPLAIGIIFLHNKYDKIYLTCFECGNISQPQMKGLIKWPFNIILGSIFRVLWSLPQID